MTQSGSWLTEPDLKQQTYLVTFPVQTPAWGHPLQHKLYFSFSMGPAPGHKPEEEMQYGRSLLIAVMSPLWELVPLQIPIQAGDELSPAYPRGIRPPDQEEVEGGKTYKAPREPLAFTVQVARICSQHEVASGGAAAWPGMCGAG